MSEQPAFSQFGRYRVVRELGRGAMGVVYLAQDESLQREVAVKTVLLPDDAQERAQQEARFRQEAKAAGGLSHPNVITIYDLGRQGDWLYIAMELLPGVELRELMVRGPMPLRLALDLAAQVASGLAAAHARGIVHRDIKPANIMVLRGNQAKIMDFGVARVQASEVKTQTGMMLGSPKYMSPEQVEGVQVDHRSDIFSLGSMLYEMVAGAAPFQGADLGALLFDIVRAAPVPPSHRNPALPELLDLIIGKALRRDPAERYQDADELARDLAHCAASLGEDTTPPAWTQGAPQRSNPPGEPDTFETTQPIATARSATVAELAVTQPFGRSATGTLARTMSAGPIASGLLPSRQFDSSAALRRLADPAAGVARARTASAARGQWIALRPWVMACLTAAVAAVWIALR